MENWKEQDGLFKDFDEKITKKWIVNSLIRKKRKND
ncbi:MAG: hypothetical protein mread185_000128 [Mycoplasmataceae bacterium]|nr:MAG: hypothetical protein mread185_000128 [Mycoplasmataceae bacterium]